MVDELVFLIIQNKKIKHRILQDNPCFVVLLDRPVPNFGGQIFSVFGKPEEWFFATTVRLLFNGNILNQLYILISVVVIM